jgi:integrase
MAEGMEGNMPSGTLHRLKAVTVKNAKPGRHADGGGLYLQVTANPGGAPRGSWLFRYECDGRERWAGLGSINDVGLPEAREAAEEKRRLLRDGIDPLAQQAEERRQAAVAAAKAITFDQCAHDYIKENRAGWRNAKHIQQWTNTLSTYVTPVFGKLPVGDIDTALVLKVLKPLWTTKPETAGRVRGRIETILDAAKVQGYRDGENPARWRGHLDKLLPKRTKVREVKHHPALPYANISAFMMELAKRPAPAARALEFTILTAVRTNEALGARWEEIDFAKKVWTIPKSRMKGNREHRVPLSDAAITVLKHMRETRNGEYVFPGERNGSPLSGMGMLMLLRRMGRSDVTVHGFRSSFRIWCAECTNYPREVAEAALAHALEDKTEEAYQRGDLFDKRRKLMDAWAKFCGKPSMERERADTVVPMPMRRPAS